MKFRVWPFQYQFSAVAGPPFNLNTQCWTVFSPFGQNGCTFNGTTHTTGKTILKTVTRNDAQSLHMDHSRLHSQGPSPQNRYLCTICRTHFNLPIPKILIKSLKCCASYTKVELYTDEKAERFTYKHIH